MGVASFRRDSVEVHLHGLLIAALLGQVVGLVTQSLGDEMRQEWITSESFSQN